MSANSLFCIAQPELCLAGVQEFVLSYLTNEYSPRSTDHGTIKLSQFRHGVRIPGGIEIGRTLPSDYLRWVLMGAVMHERDNPFERHSRRRLGHQQQQAEVDTVNLRHIAREARIPLAAIEQLETTIKDFGRIKRFSRIRTKLERIGNWQALAARFLNDQSLVVGLWTPRNQGFIMPSHPVEIARHNLRSVVSSSFDSIKTPDEFTVRRQALLLQRLPTRQTLAEVQMEHRLLDAFRIAESPRVCWTHAHREYIAVEDLKDLEPGCRLIKQVRLSRQCNDRGVQHEHNLQLFIGPEDEMPGQDELPPYQP